MKSFSQTFILHPVGQGLFYSCSISLDSNSRNYRYNFVFDCGSLNEPECQNEVENFRTSQRLETEGLDLLIISHFDADHVNHIGELLKGGVKVKKLVMPFLTFEERLFLALRIISRDGVGGPSPNSDFTISVILDPLGTLRDNLDGDSEVFLVDTGPISPIETIEDNLEWKEGDSLEFNFEDKVKEALTSEELSMFFSNIPKEVRVSKIKDNHPGIMRGVSTRLLLMDFLFYKRALGKKDEMFYTVVKRLFFEYFKIDMNLNETSLLLSIINEVKKLKSSKIIKTLFEAANMEVGVKLKGRKIDDLNTTSLCLLHRNLTGILKIVGIYQFDMKSLWDLDFWVNVHTINRRVTHPYLPDMIKFMNWRPFWIELMHSRLLTHNKFEFIAPNTILTSDSFLKGQQEIDEFNQKYGHYWNLFWLFQVPHHGSKNNADISLFAQLNDWQFNFINYGTRHRFSKTWKHPSPEIINDLGATGHLLKLLPINEYVGLEFGFGVHK